TLSRSFFQGLETGIAMREETLSSRTLFTGRVLTLDLLEVRLEDGRRSQREIIRHARAVGVLARQADGRFVWVRQYRKAMDAEVIEICAGLVDPGEDAETAARRELAEETGLTARSLIRLGEVYSSPGYSDEKVDVFFADCDPAVDELRLDADEHVERRILTREQIETAIRDGEIRDAKSIAAWHLFLTRPV
ncbi:MAG: NUDIX hydrolase, partial [Kiritimatiellia bacterium]|nr:NUDIX hydrolase [Kiritimatiellia bacterium]